jgi:GntR family transcriptional regulator, rspAB operon transcriptional repressor
MPRAILKDGLYRQLREQIISGQIPPHEPLAEERISMEFHVSRTPVREALRQLAHEGFAEYAPHCGARVAIPTPQLVQEVLLIREALEGIAAREAATKMEDSQVATLRRRFEELRAIVLAGDDSDVGDEIHRYLFQACGNAELQRMISAYWGKVEWFQHISSDLPDSRSRAFHEHDGILRGLEARDPAWAESAARAHIRNTLRELLGSFRRSEARESNGHRSGS